MTSMSRQQFTVLYIGESAYGSTSAHRLALIENHLDVSAVVVDFNSFLSDNELFRSLQWRTQSSCLLPQFKKELRRKVARSHWSLIWIDKGMFLSIQDLNLLRKHSEKFVFFTPDSFFYKNRNRTLQRALNKFDLVCTTKSFEIAAYRCLVEKEKIHLANQGFSEMPDLEISFSDSRDYQVGFVGKFERYRGEVVKALIDSGIEVHVAGVGWDKFCSRNGDESLHYHGAALFGEDYRRFYCNSLIGLGLLSKEFPELHTTRTFEIPYFGSLLATELNEETKDFYDEESALFFEDKADLIFGIKRLLGDPKKLRLIASNGRKNVINQRRSWKAQVEDVLQKVGL